MYIEILLLTVALVWLVFATVSDIKTREVPDWISFSLIIISIALLLLDSANKKDIRLLIAPAVYGIAFAIIAFSMYYTKQWGGGDTKLLIPLGIIFSSYPEQLLKYFNPVINLPFPVIIIINLLITGSAFSLIYSFYLAVKNKKEFLKEYKKHQLKKTKITSLVLTIVLIVSSTYFQYPKNILLILLSLIILITPFLVSFIKSVEKSCMIKNVPVDRLTEGDWLAEDIYSNKKLIISKNNLGLTKTQIEKIKKVRKEVFVKAGMPFVPSFLIAVLISLIFGNFIMPF